MKTENVAVQLVAAILMLGMLGLTTRAQAEDIVCATLDGLNQTMAYLSFVNDKDGLSLQGKLDEAQVKLDESKVCDAGQKIDDFNYKLTRLATASKTKVEAIDPYGEAVLCARTGSEALAAEWLDGCGDVPDRPRGNGPKK